MISFLMLRELCTGLPIRHIRCVSAVPKSAHHAQTARNSTQTQTAHLTVGTHIEVGRQWCRHPEENPRNRQFKPPRNRRRSPVLAEVDKNPSSLKPSLVEG